MAVWKTIFDGVFEGRHVQIDVYDEGGIRVHTTQGADYPGGIRSDWQATTVIFSPTEKGRKISIEGETPEEIIDALLAEGFSEETSKEIVGRIQM